MNNNGALSYRWPTLVCCLMLGYIWCHLLHANLQNDLKRLVNRQILQWSQHVCVFFPCSSYSSTFICYSSVVSGASSASAATPAANIPVAFVLIAFISSSPHAKKWLCMFCISGFVHFELENWGLSKWSTHTWHLNISVLITPLFFLTRSLWYC